MLETALVDEFIQRLPYSSFAEKGSLGISTEFDYKRGRTDIIALTPDGEVIAFEAKLSKWRDALSQAYRNTCFANFSYVILPKAIAEKASQYDIEFTDRSVGICYIDNDEIVIMKESPKGAPLENWLFERARKTLSGETSDGHSI